MFIPNARQLFIPGALLSFHTLRRSETHHDTSRQLLNTSSFSLATCLGMNRPGDENAMHSHVWPALRRGKCHLTHERTPVPGDLLDFTRWHVCSKQSTILLSRRSTISTDLRFQEWKLYPINVSKTTTRYYLVSACYFKTRSIRTPS